MLITGHFNDFEKSHAFDTDSKNFLLEMKDGTFQDPYDDHLRVFLTSDYQIKIKTSLLFNLFFLDFSYYKYIFPCYSLLSDFVVSKSLQFRSKLNG